QPMTPEEWIKKYSPDATPLAKAKAENEQLKTESEGTRERLDATPKTRVLQCRQTAVPNFSGRRRRGRSRRRAPVRGSRCSWVAPVVAARAIAFLESWH